MLLPVLGRSHGRRRHYMGVQGVRWGHAAEQAVEPDNGAVAPDALPASLVDGMLGAVGNGRRSLEDVMSALECVGRALGNLRGAGSPLELLQRAATELVVSCGFERVLVTRMTAPATMVLTAWHADPDPEDFDRRLTLWREHPPGITHLHFEGELVRRRRAGLARDAQTNPLTYKPIMEALGVDSYVAAPLTPGSQVEGMLHACRPSTGVDELDCAVLAAFAEGLSLALERANVEIGRAHV